jgi:hypothetical protein
VTAALIIAGAVAAGLLVAGLTIYFAQDEDPVWHEDYPPRWLPPRGSN